MHLKHGCILESKDEGEIFSSARKIYGKKTPLVPSRTWKTPPTFGGAIPTSVVLSFCRLSSTSLPSTGVPQLPGKSAIRNFSYARTSLVFTNPTKFNLRTSQTETSKRFVQNAFLQTTTTPKRRRLATEAHARSARTSIRHPKAQTILR